MEMSTRIFPGDKNGRCLGLTTLAHSRFNYLAIWGPQTPGVRRACSACSGIDLLSLYSIWILPHCGPPKLALHKSLYFTITTLKIVRYAIPFIGYLGARKNVFGYLLFALCFISSPLSLTYMYSSTPLVPAPSANHMLLISSYQDSRYDHYLLSA